MDGSTFDRLTRTLIRAGSRRRALGGMLAGGFGLLGSEAEDADAHDLKATCKKKSGAAKKKCLKKAKKHAAQHASEPPPPTASCPQPAAPHWCARTGSCVPACPTGMSFDPEFCGCDCAVRQSCCQCTGGASPFCDTTIDDPIDCASACSNRNPGGTPFMPAIASSGMTGVCGVGGRCEVTCAPVSCSIDACQQTGSRCQGDLQCFQPLGGGPTRCSRPTATGSCECTSHQQCADTHGVGAFCVAVTGDRCTGCEASFCATQA